MTHESGLYVGHVMHRRFKPKEHRLRYRVYWLLVDLDELPALGRSLRFFSHNGFNLFSICDRDYGSRTGAPLRKDVEAAMAQAGVACDGGAIRLLTMPRILGYAFNPLSVYFCYARSGALRAIFYEVSNTFGQHHSYLVAIDESDKALRHNAPKRFYVSPFLDMALTYAFRVKPPEQTVAVSIQCDDGAGPVIAASLVGERRDVSDRSLLAIFATHPLLTLKVVAGIHFEALRLWLKGVRLHGRPPPPDTPVTTISRPVS